jgi:hypothetical protein
MKNIVNMKNMKKVLLFAAILMTACNDDFLEKEPLDKLSEEAVFSNAALMKQYVTGLYNAIPHPFNEGTLAACTDEAFFHFGGTSCNRISRGELDPDNVIDANHGGTLHQTRIGFLVIWFRVFPYIRDMNVFLERVDAAEVSEDVKKQLKGETLFLRAWTYNNMMIRYGGIPIIRRAFQLGEAYDATRDSYDDCVQFVVNDIDAAIALLPDKATERGRASADACRALKARALLYAASPLFNDPTDPTGSVFKGSYDIEQWRLARDAAKGFLDSAGGYSLGATYDDYWKNTASTEVIWARFFDATTPAIWQYNAQLYYAPAGDGIGGWGSCKPVENLVADYEMAATGKKPFEDASGYDPDKPWEGRDPRFYKSILYPEMEYMGKTIKICSPAEGNTVITSNDKWYEASTSTGYWLRKWMIDDGVVSESVNATLMYPWFRLAEIYLIYAEAALEYNGDVGTCTEYINKVRDRADVMMPHVNPISVDDARAKLIQERRIELAFEDHRYFDLRRWKIATIYENKMIYGISAKRYDNDSIAWSLPQKGTNGEPDFSACKSMLAYRDFFLKHYLLPIPRTEVTKSSGMIVQNPYYDDAPTLK